MRTLHLISHTHWDREWYQTFQQFRLRLVHLVDELLKILDTDPSFLHFMLDGQTIVLDDYLQICPEREPDLRKYIQNGRLLIGPWYILPDEFLVSPEATIRNLLEGARGCRRFGPRMNVGYIPDPFGHIGQMPQILRGFDIESASLWRGVGDQPNEFWWAAPDGSRVLMAFLRQGYANASGIVDSGLEGFVVEARRLRNELAPHTRGEDLLLMHGVDHQEAHPATGAAVAYAAGKLDGDRLIHSTLPAYLEQLQKRLDLSQLPVVKGELRLSKTAPMLPGVLSARMWIKQRNQACETLLEKWAEPFSAWAQVYAGGAPSSKGALREAWRLLMQCHPHDSICGCSIDQVHEEMRPRFDQVDQMGEIITTQSLEALAQVIDTTPAKDLASSKVSVGVVVFNPSAAPRTDLVNVELKLLPKSGQFEIVDEHGLEVPYQAVGAGSGVLYDLRMDRNSFKAAADMVSPGSGPAGLRILGMNVVQEPTGSQPPNPEEVCIEVRVSPVGEPDLPAWESSLQEIAALLADAGIKSYHLRIMGDPTRQIRLAARNIPGMGYRTFWVREKTPVEPTLTAMNPVVRAMAPLITRLAGSPTLQGLLKRMIPDPATRPPHQIENAFFRVAVQPDGSVDVFDKRSRQLYPGQNRFVDGGDRGDTYNYSRPAVDLNPTMRLKQVRVVREGISQSLEIRIEMQIPEGLTPDRQARSAKTVLLGLTSRVTLIEGLERVEFHTELENRARDHRLRVHFEAPFAVSAGIYDGHFEVVRRPLELPAFDSSWAEQPRPETAQRAFCALSDDKNGLMVANRGLPEVEVLQRPNGHGAVTITLLRCVGWLSRGDFPERNGPAGPEIETQAAQMPGKWSFDYALIPYTQPNWAQAVQQAYAFETPLRGVSTLPHAGSLPTQGSFVAFEPAAFIPSAVKITEDGLGWLVRGYNQSNQALEVTLKTLRPAPAAWRVNLAEEPLAGPACAAGNPVTLTVKGHEIASIRFARETQG